MKGDIPVFNILGEPQVGMCGYDDNRIFETTNTLPFRLVIMQGFSMLSFIQIWKMNCDR